MNSTLLVLTRHGQTVWHRENRYAGVSDIDLTELGHRQAAALAEWTRSTRPDAIVCSPVRRARETAGPSADVLGVDPEVVEGLREVSFGVAEGLTLAELERETNGHDIVRRFRHDPAAHPFPGADAPDLAADRGAAALRHVAAEHLDRTVLVVAHNTLLRLALCSLLGIEVSRYRTVFPRLDNGALTHLRLTRDGPASLLSFNVPLQFDVPLQTAPIPSLDGPPRRVR